MTITKDDIYVGIGDFNKKYFVETFKIADELEIIQKKANTSMEEYAEFSYSYIQNLIKTLRGN